jgi:hypothetical protein
MLRSTLCFFARCSYEQRQACFRAAQRTPSKAYFSRLRQAARRTLSQAQLLALGPTLVHERIAMAGQMLAEAEGASLEELAGRL